MQLSQNDRPGLCGNLQSSSPIPLVGGKSWVKRVTIDLSDLKKESLRRIHSFRNLVSRSEIGIGAFSKVLDVLEFEMLRDFETPLLGYRTPHYHLGFIREMNIKY